MPAPLYMCPVAVAGFLISHTKKGRESIPAALRIAVLISDDV